MNIHRYFYDEYYNDVSDFTNRYKNVPNPHIVGVYKDSLPFAVHLSTILECPLSIIKVQNDTAEWLIKLTGDISVRPEKCKQFFPKLIVIDINYGTGDIFRAIKKLSEFNKNPDYTLFSIYGNQNEDNVFFNYEQIYKKIVLPWHLRKEYE